MKICLIYSTTAVPTLLLKANDTEDLIKVDAEILKPSVLIQQMLEMNAFPTSELRIPLPNVDKETLELAVKWAEFHHSNTDEEKAKSFDNKFLDIDQARYVKLNGASNYMDIKPLTALTCRKIASQIRGKTPAQICATFNIKNDFLDEGGSKLQIDQPRTEQSKPQQSGFWRNLISR